MLSVWTSLNFVIWYRVNALPIGKIFNWTKFQPFPDNKINVAENLKFLLQMVENTVGKEENAVHQHFLLLPDDFKKSV